MHPTLARLERLATQLSTDPATEAVLGLGSAGQQNDRFDDHSDIDFFVVVTDGAAKRRYVDTTDWLSGLGGQVVYDFVNDPNGRKALFGDGLFVEYAVFTPDELGAVPTHEARVVWSRPGFVLPGPAPRPSSTALDTADVHADEALTNLYVGLHRELRGERLTAMRFIQVYAVDQVLALERLNPRASWDQPDPFEPARRVEQLVSDQRPPLREMTPGYDHNAAAAAATLGWLRRWHELAAPMTSAVQALIDAATTPPHHSDG